MYYFGGGAALTAFLTAALAHELGHFTAFLLLGAEVRGIHVTAAGPVIEYAGDLSERQEMAAAAAGPAAGLLFALLCFLAGTPFFRYAGAIAVLSSMFNLMPVPPMDGGRIGLYMMETVMDRHRAERWMRWIGTACAVGAAATGVMIRSPAAAAAGIWMGILANLPELR